MFLRQNYKKFFLLTYGVLTLSKKFLFQEEEKVFAQDEKSPQLPKYRLTKRPKSLKYNIKEFRSAYLFEDLSDLVNYNAKKQRVAEQIVYLGNSKTIPENAFLQVDLNNLIQGPKGGFIKAVNPENIGKREKILEKAKKNQQIIEKDEEENPESSVIITENMPEDDQQDLEDDPKKYFNKVLIFRRQGQYYATSSFCGYDLTDLKDGVFLGNKLICPTCLSEYNVENGTAEHGPNVRFLAAFPIALQEDNLILKVPEGQVPLFSHHRNMKTLDVDPRHFVIVGDTETAVAAIDSLKKVFSGRISLVNHQTGLDFIDSNKLTKSFFPTKAKHSRWITNDYLEKEKIQVYNDKVVKIDSSEKIISLSSGIKMPFDKVLIAVGTHRGNILDKYVNCFALENVIDHANIHNYLVRKENNNFAVIGGNLRSIEIACSMRRYLDIIGKEKARVSIVVPQEWEVNKYGDEDCARIMENYLLRNRIVVLRGHPLGLQPSSDGKKLECLAFKVNNDEYRIPINMAVVENGISNLPSRCDFLNNIFMDSEEDETFSVVYRNVVTPDQRFSLHPNTRYPYIFTAGNCSAILSQYFKNQIVRTDNVGTNFHLGYIAALNMLDFHYPYDDVTVESAKVLDKWLHHVGNDTFKTKVVYKNYEKGQFVSYLINGDTVQGMLVFGFKNLHVFFKEALKLEIVPNESFVKSNLREAHLRIVTSVLKNSDKIECYKHEAFNNTTTTSTKGYSIQDQQYTNNLMKRTVSAYKYYRDKLNKENEEWRKQNEDEKRKKAQERRMKRMERSLNNNENEDSEGRGDANEEN